MSDFAKESSRFYDAEGNAVSSIIGKNGKERAPNVKDARERGLRISVTSVSKIIAAPGLERWKRQQILMSALTLPRIEGEPLEDFAARIELDSEKQGKDASERGTAIHGAIERYFRGETVTTDAEFTPYVTAVVKALADKGFAGPWEAERSFSSPIGYGGKTDLFSRSPAVVADYKTKDAWAVKPSGDPEKPMWGDDQPIQLAANAIGQGIPDARLLSVFISRTEPVQVYIKEWDDNAYWFNRFLKRLEVYKSENDL